MTKNPAWREHQSLDYYFDSVAKNARGGGGNGRRNKRCDGANPLTNTSQRRHRPWLDDIIASFEIEI